MVSYFNRHFTAPQGDSGDTVRYALQPIISREDNDSLVAIPSALEIKEAVFAINGNNAPWPDGFNASFYHTHWNEIGPYLVEDVQSSFRSGNLPAGINDIHVCLIPKIKRPQRVSDYRPISLCNVSYKVYSKILQKRLQPLLEKIISKNQSAFVPGRAIGDNVLITHEVLHTLKTSKAEKELQWRSKQT